MVLEPPLWSTLLIKALSLSLSLSLSLWLSRSPSLSHSLSVSLSLFPSLSVSVCLSLSLSLSLFLSVSCMHAQPRFVRAHCARPHTQTHTAVHVTDHDAGTRLDATQASGLSLARKKRRRTSAPESRRRAEWHSRQEDDGDRTRHGHHPTKATR